MTDALFEMMARVLLAAAIVVGLTYATEWFVNWYDGERADRSFLVFELSGAYAPLYYAMLFCNVVAPQAFWLAGVRRRIGAVFVISAMIVIGMWIEAILIVWNTLSHGYLPSSWRLFYPTIWDWLLLFGSIGFFALLFLVFIRVFPAVSAHDVRALLREQNREPT